MGPADQEGRLHGGVLILARQSRLAHADLACAQRQRPSAGAPGAGTAEPVDTRYLEGLLGYNARRAALTAISHFLESMAPYGLRPVEFSVLSVIQHNPGVTSRQLCAALGLQPPNLVGLIRQLEKRSLILRKPHPQDGRAVGLHLSAAGQRLMKQAARTAADTEASIVAHLSGEERETLLHLLQKVYRR